ncbi:hypothetical protein M406DRAFT_69312 [Cryphonectria parasitica EP155]|uniref:Uncharacterized protein n=1 Tax=Cryphonectria parasitica (strain ATCC 38755 / EP155) TaxID=660469 RepID=A0A9P5CRJ0_CRYP1|nr:uncharacterized protein M406DRAFT_69312 [Cryphonectria parasitica EP155]KAF3767150.1 hypothetical protein M406DRAFT_69312 [Cryphonectria parasitica EP155]
MSPAESQAYNLPAIMINGQALPSVPENVHANQPKVMEPMAWKERDPLTDWLVAWAPILRTDPERPHPKDTTDLRGGERSEMCPGRFCFIIPCPLPCDFCIC